MTAVRTHRGRPGVGRPAPLAVALALLGVIASLVLPTCGREGAEEPAAPDDPGAPAGEGPGGTAPVDEAAAVLAAYQGYWAAWLAAGDPPDPDHPDLARHHTGAALARARASLAEHRARGRAIRLPEGSRYRHDAVVAEVGGEVAVVHDCAHDDAVVVGPGGQVVDGAAVTNRAVATLRRLDGAWWVEDVQVHQRWEGLVPCDG